MSDPSYMRVIEAVDKALAAKSAPAPGYPATITAAALGRMEFPEPRWAVPGLIPEGLTILGGRPKMGKSWLALAMGIAVASGGCVLGRPDRVEAGDVLYLALEDRHRRLKERLGTLHPSGGEFPRRLHLATTWPRGDEGLTAITLWLEEHPEARLIVIDTLARFRAPAKGRGSAYDEDYSAIGAIQSLAITYGVAVLLVTHLRKMDADDPMDTISGTLGISGAADALMVLARVRGRAETVMHVTGRDIEDAALALLWDAPTCTWTATGDASLFRISPERQAILTALKDGPKYPKELTVLLGKASGSIRKLLHDMLRDGQVSNSGTLYSLPLVMTNNGNTGNGGNTGNTGNTGNALDRVTVTDPLETGNGSVTPICYEYQQVMPSVTDVTDVTDIDQIPDGHPTYADESKIPDWTDPPGWLEGAPAGEWFQ